MADDWRVWIGRKVKDITSGIEGHLHVENNPADVPMDEGGVIHSDEVTIIGNNPQGGLSQLYLGSARNFERFYVIDAHGQLRYLEPAAAI